MIALQRNGPRFAFVWVAGHRRQPFHFLLDDDLLSVQRHADLASYETDVESLPLTGRAAGVFRGQDAAIQRAVAMRVGGPPVVVEDLHFVTGSQADAAIRLRAHAEFGM